jgi:PHD/YefM family antitoxin component YafN of YafNO toxin-antitoxin module
MAGEKRVRATEFQREPGRFQELALRQPVIITHFGRDRLVLLPAEDYRLLKSKAASRPGR